MTVWQGLGVWLLGAVVLVGLIARIGAGLRRRADRREREADAGVSTPASMPPPGGRVMRMRSDAGTKGGFNGE